MYSVVWRQRKSFKPLCEIDCWNKLRRLTQKPRGREEEEEKEEGKEEEQEKDFLFQLSTWPEDLDAHIVYVKPGACKIE